MASLFILERNDQMENHVKKELKKQRENIEKKSYFWGYIVAVFSILQSGFLFIHTDYMADRFNAYLFGVNQNVFAIALLIAGVIKMAGLLLDETYSRQVGIVALCAIWGMLSVVALFYSFGIGYPSNAFLTNGLILVACLRVAYKGVFKSRCKI